VPHQTQQPVTPFLTASLATVNPHSMPTHFLRRISLSLMGLRARRSDTLAGATGVPHSLPHHRSYHVYVALGSNLGDRSQNLKRAVEALNEVRIGWMLV